MGEHERMTSDRLLRVREGRILTGVCTGLGRYTGIDPLVFRVVFALLAFATWCALPLYGLALSLMPDEQGDEPAPLERLSGRLLAGRTVLTLLGVLLGAGILLDLTGQGLLQSLGGDSLAALVIAALIVLTAQARGADVVAEVRALPDGLRGTPLPAAHHGAAEAAPAPSAVPLREESQAAWIDLATLQPYRPEAPSKEDSVPAGLVVREPEHQDTAPVSAPDSGATAPGPPVSETAPERPAPRRRPPVLAGITLLCASAAGASSLVFTSDLPGTASLQVAFATALATLALGLVVGARAGGSQGLVAVGALLSVALIGSNAVTEVQDGARFGEVSWRPVDPRAAEPYRVLAGRGVLDLTALPLRDGERYRVAAEVGFGGLRVVLPALAQVELHLATDLGDITVDRRITGGPRARVERTLPGSGVRPPVLELHVKGRFGDLEVVRGRP